LTNKINNTSSHRNGEKRYWKWDNEKLLKSSMTHLAYCTRCNYLLLRRH